MSNFNLSQSPFVKSVVWPYSFTNKNNDNDNPYDLLRPESMQELVEETETITEVLTLDSGDRDVNLYPNPNSYVIDLLKTTGRTFKNVKEIRLLTGTFPDQNNILREPYLILSVAEFNDSMSGTNTYMQSGSCILQLDRAITTGYFFNLKTDLCKCIVHNFQNPKEISKLTIKIYDKSGNLFNFGSDSPAPLKSLQHMLSFEFTMEVKKPVFRSRITKTY